MSQDALCHSQNVRSTGRFQHWPRRRLKHLFSSHISLRTQSSKLAPADALRIAGCSSRIVIEAFPSRPHPPPRSTDVNAGSTSRRRALISVSSDEAASGSSSVPNNAATLLSSHHTPAKMAGVRWGGGRVQSDRQAGADRHAAL